MVSISNIWKMMNESKILTWLSFISRRFPTFSSFIVNIIGIFSFQGQKGQLEVKISVGVGGIWEQFERRPCGMENDWEFRLTFNGYCLEYNNDTAEYDNGTAKKPSKVKFMIHFSHKFCYYWLTFQKISVQRQTSLGAMFAYNRSDWTYGWMAAFDGFTVFYAEVHLNWVHRSFLCLS